MPVSDMNLVFLFYLQSCAFIYWGKRPYPPFFNPSLFKKKILYIFFISLEFRIYASTPLPSGGYQILPNII